ncbi:MAG: N-acetyltransferase family protein [Actinobacteria bacterium]|nr:MAG: N-acetyltransferase family protein [Actinomycetota bacterium]
MHIRTARLTDAEAIRGIYNRAIGTIATFDLEPRSLEEQQQWLAMRSGAHVVLVADENGIVAGFASLSPYRDRPAYRTTVENSVYVDESHQGKGVGKQLMTELIDTARDHGFHSMIARIVSGNASSIALHRGLAFEIVGVEKEVGRKLGRWLDVVVMQRMLDTR